VGGGPQPEAAWPKNPVTLGLEPVVEHVDRWRPRPGWSSRRRVVDHGNQVTASRVISCASGRPSWTAAHPLATNASAPDRDTASRIFFPRRSESDGISSVLCHAVRGLPLRRVRLVETNLWADATGRRQSSPLWIVWITRQNRCENRLALLAVAAIIAALGDRGNARRGEATAGGNGSTASRRARSTGTSLLPVPARHLAMTTCNGH